MLILAIVIQFLRKDNEYGTIDKAMLRSLCREVYLGASIGFAICLSLGACCILAASAIYQLFEGDAVYWADGILMTIACLFLTGLALNFYKLIHTREIHERKLKNQVNEVIKATKAAGDGMSATFGKKHAFFVFALVTGLREGLESIIFLISVITDFPDPSYMASLPIPIILALFLSRVLGLLFFQGTKRMSIKPFVRSACLGCMLIAAGMFTSSMHKWQELGAFGTWSPRSERPWLNSMVFDASECCNDKSNKFWVLMRALFGWQDQPTPIEFFAFPFYWLTVTPILCVLISRWKKSTEKKLLEWRAEDALAEDSEKSDNAPPITPIAADEIRRSEEVAQGTVSPSVVKVVSP
jgi:FTR1 family protein